MPALDTGLDDALRLLTGAKLYQGNIFRITGLPTDATPTAIRRRREELELAAELGAAEVGGGELPLPAAPDADTVRAAFEAMRDPLTRLVHEMLWLWPPGEGAERAAAQQHNEATRVHCTTLEAEAAGEGDPDERDRLWYAALAGWAELLAGEGMWNYASRRIREIDDPRLTSGTIRRLREKLPGHIVAAGVSVAAQAANAQDLPTAERLVRLLRESPFDEAVAQAQLRSAARTAEDRVRRADNATGAALGGDLSGALPGAADLLERTARDLNTLDVLLGADHPLSRAVHDEVAITVNRSVITFSNSNADADVPPNLLRQARRLAREQTTIDLIDGNIRATSVSPVLRHAIALAIEGDVDHAAFCLRVLRRRTADADRRREIEDLLSGPSQLVGRLKGSVMPFRLFGVGTILYGRRQYGRDNRFISTMYFSIIAIPLIPIRSYLRKGPTAVYGRVALSMAALWWRRVFTVGAPALLADWWTSGPVWLWTLLVMLLAVGVPLLFREFRTRHLIEETSLEED